MADILRLITRPGPTGANRAGPARSLVAAINHRTIPLLGKTIATLDVLSGGRAMCGLGLGWFTAEQRALGLDLPPIGERYELLEDALRFLPLLWGAGAPAFDGHRLHVREALCYPRPLQARIPIMVGGNGERRTLPLVARYGDACNLFGQPDDVTHKEDDACENARDSWLSSQERSHQKTNRSSTPLGHQTFFDHQPQGTDNTRLHLQGAPQRPAGGEGNRPLLRALSGARRCCAAS